MAILAVCTGACSRCIEPPTSRETDQRVAADRVARGRGRTDQILALDLAEKHHIPRSGRCRQAALAHRTRLSGAQAGGRARALRRARVAWLPSSRHAVHRGLRIPDLREGDDSPLRTSFRHSAPATCRTRQLPTPRIPPCGLNGTSQTRSPPCAEGSSQLSSNAYHAAHAAVVQPRNVRVAICNAVVLGPLPDSRYCPPDSTRPEHLVASN